jgi:hypothetical protein
MWCIFIKHMEQNVQFILTEDTSKYSEPESEFEFNYEFNDHIDDDQTYDNCLSQYAQHDAEFCLLVDYNENNTCKQLQRICDYYSIKINKSKNRKTDMIHLILLFENEPTNKLIVAKRRILWNYIAELEKDRFMKKFILW